MSRGPRPLGARAERLTLVALDVAAFAVGLRAAYELYVRSAPTEAGAAAPRFGTYSDDLGFGTLVALQVLVMVGVFFFLRLYHQPRGVSRIDLSAHLFRAVTIGAVATTAAAAILFPGLDYSRRILVLDWLATFAFVLGLRLVHRTTWGALRRAGYGRTRIIVVGAGREALDLVGRIQDEPWLGYEIVGLVDDTPGRTRARGVPLVGRTDRLGRLVEELDVDEVLIALPGASRQKLLNLISQCSGEGLAVNIYPDVFQILATEVRIGHLKGLPLLAVRDFSLAGWRRTMKRLVDLAVAGTALVAVSPLLVVLAILVKLESPGPAFYIQERMGLDAKPFPTFKLRTMRADAERDSGAVWARRDDPRRTRLGRVLRRTSIDELPQLVNVVLGHMSVVGPRPERPEFVAEFERNIPRYMERHREKAGITGWAQVNGLRGDTSIEERTKYDLFYIENWSLLFDFKIMALTVVQQFRDKNAY